MSAILSTDDLQALTGYRRPKRQREALAAMGVRHYTRPDGRPVVAVADLRQGHGVAAREVEPNWGALEGQP